MRSFTVRGSESPGSKASVVRSSREGAEPIDEIVESGRSPLDSIVRDGVSVGAQNRPVIGAR